MYISILLCVVIEFYWNELGDIGFWLPLMGPPTSS